MLLASRVNRRAKRSQGNPDKYMDRAILKAEKELQEKTDRAVPSIYAAFAIVMKQKWGMTAKNIKDILEESFNGVTEISGDNTVSSLLLLERETGIELRSWHCPDKSYHECAFASAEAWDGTVPSKAYYLKMRQEQTKWLDASIMAVILVGLHRKRGWTVGSIERCIRYMFDVMAEYGYNDRALVQASLDIARVRLHDNKTEWEVECEEE